MVSLYRCLGLAMTLAMMSTLMCIGAAAQARKLEKEEVGVWLVEAYTNRDGTDFDHCTMSAIYDDTALIFYIDRDFYWAIGLANDKWKLTKGDEYNVDIHVDKGKVARRVARVRDTDWVDIDMGNSDDLFEDLRRGETLHIDTPGRGFSFNLVGTFQGLSALYDCVDRHTREAYQANPFAGPPSADAAQSAPPSSDAIDQSTSGNNVGEAAGRDYRIEAERMLEALLQTARVSDYTLVKSTDSAEGYDRFAAVWRGSTKLFGVLYVVPNEEEGLAERTLTAIANSQRETCAGKFVAKTDMLVRMQGIYMPRAYGGCSDGGNSTMLYASAFQRRQGGFYVFLTVSSEGGSPNDVADIDERLRQAAYQNR